MPGNMGNEQSTVQNLKVLKADRENGIVIISGMSFFPPGWHRTVANCLGAVSGPKGCVVRLQDAIKKPWPEITPAESAPAEEIAEST